MVRAVSRRLTDIKPSVNPVRAPWAEHTPPPARRNQESEGTIREARREETSMTLQRFIASTVVAALTVTGCSDQPAPAGPGPIRLPGSADLSQQQPGRYIVSSAAAHVPPDFAVRVATPGGSVEPLDH